MDVLKSEVDANFDYFERNLSQFLPDHLGQYALLHQRTLVDFFDKAGDAYRAGLSRFPDKLFSIQEVNDEPVDLGFFSRVGG
ncbi:MAG: hypothetical protein ABL918_11145 [Chakrabartia sp.]